MSNIRVERDSDAVKFRDVEEDELSPQWIVIGWVLFEKRFVRESDVVKEMKTVYRRGDNEKKE